MKLDIKKLTIIAIISFVIGAFAPGFAADLKTLTHKVSPAIKYATKVPVGRKQLALKFLIAMFGVGASSVIIYVGLSVYNKFMYGGNPRGAASVNSEDDSYKTPNNMKDALDIFLKKTK